MKNQLKFKNKLSLKIRNALKATSRFQNKLKSKSTKGYRFEGVDWIINRIQSSFFRQLSALKKFGAITDLFITRSADENRFLMLMGY